MYILCNVIFEVIFGCAQNTWILWSTATNRFLEHVFFRSGRKIKDSFKVYRWPDLIDVDDLIDQNSQFRQEESKIILGLPYAYVSDSTHRDIQVTIRFPTLRVDFRFCFPKLISTPFRWFDRSMSIKWSKINEGMLYCESTHLSSGVQSLSN